MFLRSLFLIFIGLCSGAGIAAGTFAFLLVLRVLPRLLQKTKLEHMVIHIENAVVCGILFGTIFSLFTWEKKLFIALLGRFFLTIYGFCAGIFVGCLAVALAEILDVFPIFFRRLHIRESFSSTLIFLMAIGKVIGSLFFFLTGYDTMMP